jgi:hypothetical protein
VIIDFVRVYQMVQEWSKEDAEVVKRRYLESTRSLLEVELRK